MLIRHVNRNSPGKCLAAGSVAEKNEIHDISTMVDIITCFGFERRRFDILPVLGLDSGSLEDCFCGLFVGCHRLESWRRLSKKHPHDCYRRVPDGCQVVTTLRMAYERPSPSR